MCYDAFIVKNGILRRCIMAKRLYTLLSSCQTEEEVKAEFAKFFKLKMNTRHKIDLYTPHVLFEFKYNQNFKNNSSIARAIAQTLYYVRRLKYGTSYDPVPPTICVVDKDEGFFIHTKDYSVFYNAARKYDWDRAASQPCPVLVDAVEKALNNRGVLPDIHVYSFSVPSDEKLFIDTIESELQQTLFDTAKKSINEENFANVYLYWQELFGKYVKNGHKVSEYFVSDIESGQSQTIGKTTVLFQLGDGSYSKNVPMKDYNYFWSIYDKIENPEEIKAIRQKIDRLSEDFMRRFTGEFYTPIEFASKAFEYIERTVGPKRYHSGNWRIWDMAAGTGNLEFSLPSTILKNCYISTLLEDDAAYCKKIFPTATVFQYDYLNDDTFLISNPGHLPFGVTPKMPKNLYDDLQNPDISWIIFINPPFVTSNKMGREIGKTSKDDVSMTFVREIMNSQGLGETSRELFTQFLYRISVEFSDKTAFLGLFSTIKYLNANNDQMLRDTFFQYHFERGFMFSSEAFVGSKGKFPVGFLVWNLSKREHIDTQTIVLDVYDTACEKVGTKAITTTERNQFLNKWVERKRNTGIMPPFSSALGIALRSVDVRDKVADGFLCSLMSAGNDIQHQNYTALLSGPYASAGGFSVVPENFEKSMILHAVRRIPVATWDNDRDQFYQPFAEPLSEEFTNDCVIWSAFSPSNNTVSLKDIVYKGKTYQIENQMFPFLLSEVKTWDIGLSNIKSQVFTANEDRFLAKWISSHTLSTEAEAVIKTALPLYKYVFSHLSDILWLDYRIELWDLGWWQVRSAAKDMESAGALLKAVNSAEKELEVKLRKQIPELGFTPPQIVPLANTL